METIEDDLVAVSRLQADSVHVDGFYHAETGTLQLRVLVGGEHSEGCFHRIAGTLTALRLEVLGEAVGRIPRELRTVQQAMLADPLGAGV